MGNIVCGCDPATMLQHDDKNTGGKPEKGKSDTAKEVDKFLGVYRAKVHITNPKNDKGKVISIPEWEQIKKYAEKEGKSISLMETMDVLNPEFGAQQVLLEEMKFSLDSDAVEDVKAYIDEKEKHVSYDGGKMLKTAKDMFSDMVLGGVAEATAMAVVDRLNLTEKQQERFDEWRASL